MRILVITPYFFPHPGGSQQYIEGLYTALKNIRTDIEVDVMCYNTDHQKAVEQHGIFTIYRVPCLQILHGQFAVPNYFAVRKLIKKLQKDGKKYDIVNAHTRFFESSWWTPLVAKSFNAKSIFTDHCASHPWHPNPFVRFIAQQVDSFIAPAIAKKYDVVTVVSEATKKFLESFHITVDTVIPCGIDTSVSQTVKTFNAPITIGFVGRMIPSKHPEIVLEVINQLQKDGQKVKGLFVGGGQLFEQLKSQKISGVEFTGSLSHEKTQEALTKIDILLHPSVHHEGLPMVLLEAGKAGCAVIASPQGGSPEVIENGKTGIIAKATEEAFYTSTVELLNNPAKIEQFGKALQKKVQIEFNWKTIAGKYSDLMAKV